MSPLHCDTITGTCTVCVYATCRNCPVNACTQYEARTFSEERQEEEWNSEEMLEFMNTVTQRQGEKERERERREREIYIHTCTIHHIFAWQNSLMCGFIMIYMYFFSIELSYVCNRMR